jgi:3-oxoacyl-[acyl-carrier-protein] synthase-1
MTVAVAGIGAITAVGLCAGSTMAAQRAGISGQAEHAYLLDREGEPMRVAAVPWGEADGRITERLVELAVQAAQDAMARADGRMAIDVMLALPESRPGLPEGFAVEVGTRFAEVFRKGMAGGKVKVLPRGHAGGLALMGQASTLLRERPERAVLVGGVDSRRIHGATSVRRRDRCCWPRPKWRLRRTMPPGRWACYRPPPMAARVQR